MCKNPNSLIAFVLEEVSMKRHLIMKKSFIVLLLVAKAHII